MSLPPGPAMPGLLQTLGMLSRPHGFLERCRRRYGDVFTLNVAPYGRMVFLADPALIRQVFTGDTHVFHVGGVRGRVLGPMLGEHSLLLLDEDEHMRERKLMLPAFHGDALRSYPALISEIAEAQVREWPVGVPVALRPRMQAITLEVILRLVIGVRDPDALARLRELLGRMLEQSTTLLFLATAINRDLSWFPPWARFLSIRSQADELVYREIARRRSDPGGDDILSLLVQSSGGQLSDQELRDELMTLLIAGHETTATALAWAFERLTRHPDVLARVREGDPAYLDAVIKETLRIRPVVMEVGRDLTEDTRIGEWQLPAGTRVMSSIGLVQKASEHWPDPAAFNPDRFLNGSGPAPYTWIPFGGGPRRCMGASFATTEMAAIIPLVLNHFDLVPDRPEPERSQTRNVTQVPSRGARVVLASRSSPPSRAESDGSARRRTPSAAPS